MAGTIKDYIGYGTLAARPASPGITALTGGSALYYATDTNTEYAWDGSVWHAISTGGASGMTQISQQVLGANTATVSFTTIPGTYSELLLVIWGRGTAAQWFCDVNLQFNSDTGSNYIGEILYGTQATPTAADNTLSTNVAAGLLPGGSALAGVAGTIKVSIPAYASTAFHKPFMADSASMQDSITNNRMRRYAVAGGWKSTSAITRIDINCDATSFATGSVFTLYGIS